MLHESMRYFGGTVEGELGRIYPAPTDGTRHITGQYRRLVRMADGAIEQIDAVLSTPPGPEPTKPQPARSEKEVLLESLPELFKRVMGSAALQRVVEIQTNSRG